MNKHEEARKILNRFRNAYYNAIFYEKEKEVANALNEVLPYLEATEKAYEELKRDVKKCMEYLEDDDVMISAARVFNNHINYNTIMFVEKDILSLKEKLSKVGNEIVSEILKVDDKSRSCKVCGCTQERACPGGCHWVTDDLCSNCVFSIFTCEATVAPNESLEPIDGTSDYLADEIVSEEICEGYVAGHAAALGLSSEAEDTALHIGDRVRVYAVYQHSEIIKQIVYVLEPKKE